VIVGSMGGDDTPGRPTGLAIFGLGRSRLGSAEYVRGVG